jgi:hypothetical protein
METSLVYASAGGVRTYPHLLGSRTALQMQLMVTLLAVVYVRGWMTESGCTRAAEVRVISPMNG